MEHKCSLCEYTSKRQFYVIRHMKNVHGVESSDDNTPFETQNKRITHRPTDTPFTLAQQASTSDDMSYIEEQSESPRECDDDREPVMTVEATENTLTLELQHKVPGIPPLSHRYEGEEAVKMMAAIKEHPKRAAWAATLFISVLETSAITGAPPSLPTTDENLQTRVFSMSELMHIMQNPQLKLLFRRLAPFNHLIQ